MVKVLESVDYVEENEHQKEVNEYRDQSYIICVECVFVENYFIKIVANEKQSNEGMK